MVDLTIYLISETYYYVKRVITTLYSRVLNNYFMVTSVWEYKFSFKSTSKKKIFELLIRLNS